MTAVLVRGCPRVNRRPIRCLALCMLAACAGSDATSSPGVFQLVDVTSNVRVVQCSPFTQRASPESIYLYVHLVNTTGTDVTVNNVASVGRIIQAPREEIIGLPANNFVSLPFSPQPVLVHARDGDVTMTVPLPTSQLCAPTSVPIPELQWKDATAGIRVTTTAGLYDALPFTIHVNFVGPGVPDVRAH